MRIASRAIAAFAVTTVGLGVIGTPAAASDGYRSAFVVDGDTIDLLNGRSVRLLGYDTPEVGECGYDEAFTRMADLLRRPVKLVNRSGTDRYGRILAYVKTRNGRDVGTVMLRRGLAVARYDSLDGYPWHPKQELYRSLDSTNGEIVCPDDDASIPDPVVDPVVPPVAPPAPVYYENCDAVRAAGAAPIYRGQPGYAPHLDRDGDGIGCED
jgi:endonuclease YncB( thermonuclease family)